MDEKSKIDALIENYKIISEETKSYLTEMIRCFIYAAIILAVGFGYGEHFEKIVKYMPIALMGLFIYFFSLGFMYVNASRYKAQIENKINKLAADTLFDFELIYKAHLLKTGLLPFRGKNILPVPNLLLAIMILLVYIYLVWNNQKFWTYVIAGFIFSLIALYVFLIIPRVIEKYQKEKKWIDT